MNVKVSVVLLLCGCLALVSLPAAEDASKISPSIAQVVKMHEAGVAPDVLLAYVKETPISKPNAEEVLYLTEKGIPKDVIVAMLSKRVWADAPPPQSQPAPEPGQTQPQLPPAVTTTKPATETVVYTAPLTYVGPAPYYSPWYYDPWPRVSVGIGFGYGWYGGYHGYRHHHHHGGGIHVHRRR